VNVNPAGQFPNKGKNMIATLATPRITRLPAIALLPVLAFSLAGQALGAAPPAPTDSTIQGDSIQNYNLRGISQPAGSSVPARDKSGYIVTSPTLRPFDNFGAENAHTIGAGNFSVNESFGYGWRQRSGDMWQRTDESWFIGRTLVEYGLTDKLDFRAGITPWNIRTETLKDPTGQDSRTRSGVGNVMLGGKWSLLDNDSGPNPLSVVGTINLPTASERLVRHDNLEGGLGVQYERQLPGGFQIRANSSFTLSKSDRGCWNSCFNNRLVVYRELPLVEKLSVYGGINTGVSTSPREPVNAEFLTGVIYQLNHNFELSAGSTFGVNGNAYDFGPSVSVALIF
jgi:hypothetical protein